MLIFCGAKKRKEIRDESTKNSELRRTHLRLDLELPVTDDGPLDLIESKLELKGER